MRTNKRTFPAAEIALENPSAGLDPKAIFGRVAPLEVDLGCGDGTFLVALAREHPERDFLGIERLPGRVRGACRKIGDGQLPNARVLQAEIRDVLAAVLPPASVEILYLLFSDPWPKRRHLHRRVINEEFLRAALRVLVPGGELRLATDHADYFAQMQRIALSVTEFDSCALSGRQLAFGTTFEERFRALGVDIYRLILRKR
jgi:tRNA (guanine-N7-)-methyltransferase